MKRIILYFLTYVLLPAGESQTIKRDTIKLPENRPVKYGYTFAPTFHGDPLNGITIYSYSPASDSVYSVSKGNVKAVRKIDDYFLCIIETADTFYIYTLLQITKLLPGAAINEGDCIGQMKSDSLDAEANELLIQIKRKNSDLSFEKQLECLVGKSLRSTYNLSPPFNIHTLNQQP